MLATGGASLFNLQNSGYGTCAVVCQKKLVMVGGQGSSEKHGHVDRWIDSKYQTCTFFPRYDSQGNYLSISPPDLATARAFHACATFISSQGEEVQGAPKSPTWRLFSYFCSSVWILLFQIQIWFEIRISSPFYPDTQTMPILNLNCLKMAVQFSLNFLFFR